MSGQRSVPTGWTDRQRKRATVSSRLEVGLELMVADETE